MNLVKPCKYPGPGIQRQSPPLPFSSTRSVHYQNNLIASLPCPTPNGSTVSEVSKGNWSSTHSDRTIMDSNLDGCFHG
ncbi:hypothetical protein RRG08_024432 [Elysia crispata]|uniref:Uncharacterized protein n=1 Tax=Elysia crispata TaxID=231223 RepID=A0AAE0YPE1_9GAST|nr:hypothetical protein RRG08_024432 [Elysia crispata]